MADDGDMGGRATLAIVYRTVDDLGKRMDAHFDGVKTRLDKLEPVEARVDGHDRILADHETRIIAAEAERAQLRLVAERTKSERSTWRKVQLPGLIVSTLSVTVALAALIVFH